MKKKSKPKRKQKTADALAIIMTAGKKRFGKSFVKNVNDEFKSLSANVN